MRVLAGDIGGTKTILGVFEKEEGAWRVLAEERFDSNAYATFPDLLMRFVMQHRLDYESACFGVAGPVNDNRVRGTNLAWAVDGREVASAIGVPCVRVINDFAAQALGVFEVAPAHLVWIHEKVEPPIAADAQGPVAVIGAGTGLGEAGIVRAGGRPLVVPSEGGHADLAPRTEREIDLLRFLSQRFGRVSYERVLSGQGLVNVYEFVRETSGRPAHPKLAELLARGGDPAPHISQAAIEGWDPAASEALDMFVAMYGAEAGNMALRFLATGGVYVTGGIAAKVLPRIQAGGFLTAFKSKGRLSPLLRTIPIAVVTDPRAGLLGAAAEGARLAKE